MPKHTYNPRRNSVADIERVVLLRISTANIADCRSLDQPSWLASNSAGLVTYSRSSADTIHDLSVDELYDDYMRLFKQYLVIKHSCSEAAASQPAVLLYSM